MEGLKGEDTIAVLWRQNYRYGRAARQMARLRRGARYPRHLW